MEDLKSSQKVPDTFSALDMILMENKHANAGYLKDTVNEVKQLLEYRALLMRQELMKGAVNPFTLKPVNANEVMTEVPAGATPASLIRLEKVMERPVPIDLKKWLQLTNGPPGFFGLNVAQRSSDIFAILDDFPTWRRKGYIPVASNDNGCFYAQSLNHSSKYGCAIVFMGLPDDLEEPWYACSSNMLKFSEFLMRYFLSDNKALGNHIELWPRDRGFMMREDPEILNVKGIPLPWDE